jgi:REP element-mobilizing transposase RayT
MANSYTQLYIHCIWVVKGRVSMINPIHNDELQKYITWIVANNKSKVYAINNMPDHFHMLISLHPGISLSDLMQKVKWSSSKRINEQWRYPQQFSRQPWYGAFSYAKSQINTVCTYIHNQQEHHKTQDFKSEYLSLLKKFDIEYDEKYVFEFYD